MCEANNLNPELKKILDDIFKNGPDCAKFISRRLSLELRTTMDYLDELEKLDLLEKVHGTFLMKPGMKKPKHMNHTYYQLSRKAKHQYR
jgi:predicted transcriptional regulator